MNLGQIRRLLRHSRLSPNSRFGQNFLHDENLARWIVNSTGVTSGKRVLEIGPGLGALTEFLIQSGAHVTAIEIDNGLADFLEQRFQGQNLKIIRGDAVKILKKMNEEFQIFVGNLPYNAAVPLIVESLISGLCRERFVCMVQEEIFKRMSSLPSRQEYGSVSVITQIFCRIIRTRSVGKKVFYPEPQIRSTIVGMEPRDEIYSILSQKEQREEFCNFVRTSFVCRRKMLGNVLAKLPTWRQSVFDKLNLTGRERAEQLEPELWLQLFMNFKRHH